MRKIILKDAFALSRIIKGSNALADILKAYQDRGMTDEERGVIVVQALIYGLPEQEQQIYDLLDGIYQGAKSIGDMTLEESAKAFKEIAEENDLMAFFTRALKLAQRI